MERPPGARVRPSRLKSICLNQATRFTIQDRGELDFMDAIYIDDSLRHVVAGFGYSEVGSKPAFGKSLDNVLEADFWGVSEISFVRLQTCGRHNCRVAVREGPPRM